MDSSGSTKDSILKVAAEIFANNSYSKTSVRDICKAAGVNVAAINYHFGNKENLYVEVVRYWKNIAFEKFPLDICFDKTIKAEIRLKHFIKSQLFHTLFVAESPWFGALVSRECLEPTKALREITQESLGPGIEALIEIVAELLGKESPNLRFIAASILGQCTFYQNVPAEIVEKYFCFGDATKENILQLSERIYEFSMNAINGLKNA